MAERPINHLQALYAARRQASAPAHSDWPEISLELVVRMEDEFPQACMEPGDKKADHLHYAGAAQVARLFRQLYEAQQEEHREARQAELDDVAQETLTHEMELP